MHFRAPSVFNGISAMRRRSAGAITYKHHVNSDASFASSHSQPNVSLVLGSSGAMSSAPPVPPHVEEGYHIYSSVATSDGVGEDTLEPATLSSSANNDLLSDSLLDSTYTAPLSSEQASTSFNYNENGMNSVDTDSSDNCQMAPTTNAAGSIDSGHRGLIPTIGTTPKFTHKWPRPGMLKYLDSQSTSLHYTSIGIVASNSRGAAATSLEEGQGLGMSHIASWTTFKWLLLTSVMTVFTYGCAGLIMAIMTWFNAWQGADVMFVADNDVLILITLTGSILLFTSLIGITGTLLNSRPILAIYGLLLWPAMLSLLAIGYTSYRRYSLSLDHKLNLSWSRYFTPVGRRTVQDSLQCCGFYSSMHEAAPSKKCYLRAGLPGCKAKLFDFERANLRTIWKTVFSLAPLHLANMVVALLCANHITVTFGKGIIPLQYRLNPKDVKSDADKILSGNGADPSKSGLFREDVDHDGRTLLSEKS